jgi:hypothetical protein
MGPPDGAAQEDAQEAAQEVPALPNDITAQIFERLDWCGDAYSIARLIF